MVHVQPPERCDPPRGVGDDIAAIGSVEHPVEEARLSNPKQPGPLEELAREEHAGLMARRVEVEADHGVADQGGEQHQVGVLDKQLVGVFELRPQRTAQQLGPQLSLQRDRWVVLGAMPAVQEGGSQQSEGGRTGPEAFLQRRQCRRDLPLGREHRP